MDVEAIVAEEVGWRTEEELLAAVSPDPLPEVYITVETYMQWNGCCHSTALRELEAHVEAGLVRKRKARLDGRERWIFY